MKQGKQPIAVSALTGEAMAHLSYLCNTIGPRLIGSPQNLAAADYIEGVFQAAHLQTYRQEFVCPAWTVEETYLAVDGKPLTALANTFSPSCDVTAPMRVVGTLPELKAASLTDHICVIYGDLTKEPLSALRNPVYLPERHRNIAELLREKQPIAIITISMLPEYPLLVIEDWEMPIPSLTVPSHVGVELLEKRNQIAHVRIATQREQSQSYNVIGKKMSTGQNRIIMSAHYDTKHGTPGAYDNGSGVTVLLTLAKLFAAARLSVDLEFIAFSGEEYGLGGDTYLRQYGLHTLPFGQQPDPSESAHGLSQVIAAINIDGVGQQVGTNAIGMIACSEGLQKLVSEILAARISMITIDPGPASNHYDFYTHGVPSIVASSVGLGNVIHHPRDTVEWISSDKLIEVILFVQQLVERLQDKSPSWAR